MNTESNLVLIWSPQKIENCSKFFCRISWVFFWDRSRDRKTDEPNLFTNAEALNTRDWESSLSKTSIWKFPVRASQKSHFCNVEHLHLLAVRACMFTYIISRPFQVSKQHHWLHRFFYTCKNSYKQIHTPQSITNP